MTIFLVYSAPEDYKVNPGAVEVIVEQPGANHVVCNIQYLKINTKYCINYYI